MRMFYTESLFNVLCFQKLSALISILISPIDTSNKIDPKQKIISTHSMYDMCSPSAKDVTHLAASNSFTDLFAPRTVNTRFLLL